MALKQRFLTVQQYWLKPIIMFCLLLFIIPKGYSQDGCTDPLANNYDINAVTNDGSCTYEPANISPINSTQLNAALNETSGLIFWDNEVWTHLDGGNPTELYNLGLSDFTTFSSINLPGVTNVDWEEIAQDDTYVYIGDFGNNANGNRTDLNIYRITKTSIVQGTPVVDIINFSYEDQTDFSPQGGNNTDFDCEAFIVTDSNIYLFTKEWVSLETTVYSLPKTPGTYSAVNEGSYNVNGLVTGSTLVEGEQLIVLSGYSQTLQPFLFLLYDFSENNFFSGNKRKINLNLPFHQVEGITSKDGLNYFASNERIANIITIPPRIHEINLTNYVLDYLGYITSGNSTNFDEPSAWVPGVVPPDESKIKIAHDLNLNQNYTAGIVQIEENVDFTANSNLSLSTQELRLSTDSNLILNPGSVLNVNGNIANDGTLYFKSNETDGSAQFDKFNGNISGSGEVTVERFISAKRAFRLLTSAIDANGSINENWQEGVNNAGTNYPEDNLNPNPGFGTHITGGAFSDGFDQNGSGNPSMFTFNNAFIPTGTQTQFDGWTPLPNTNSTTLNAGEAYLTFIRGDRSINVTSNTSTPTNTVLRTTGNLYTGILNFNVNNSTDYLKLSDQHEFYSLVGNPYQAVVDYNQVTKDDLTDFIYIWDATLGGTDAKGGYVSVELPSGDETIIAPTPGSSDASQFIAPGMSFFVQNLESGSDAITAPFSPAITFSEEDKAIGENEITVFENFTLFYINSRLYKTYDLQNGNTESDALGLRFSDNYTTLGNNDEDATKLDNPDETYAVNNNGLRSIDKQGLPDIGHEINLSITNYTETHYSLSFVMENKPEDLNVFLKDEYLNTETELTQTFVYDFSVDTTIPESTDTGRFVLVFNPQTLNNEETLDNAAFSIYPNPTRDVIYIAVSSEHVGTQAQMSCFDVMGRQVLSQKDLILEPNNPVDLSSLPSGIYLLKLNTPKLQQNFKIQIE